MVDESNKVVATFNSLKAFCQDFTIGACTINLNAESTGDSIFDYNANFSITVTAPTYDNTTDLVSITFITDNLIPKTVRMDIFRNNQFGNRSVCTNSLTSASGTLDCDVSSITDSDQFLFIDVYVDGQLFKQYTINLNTSILGFGILNGSFYAFLMILMLISLFMEDKKILVISLGLGWIVIISLGLVNGLLIGSTSAGIWLLVTIGIFMWKLNKEKSL